MNTTIKVSGYKLLLGYLGIITTLIGFTVLLPLITLLAFPEELNQAKYFIIPGAITCMIGFFFSLLIKNKEKAHLEKNSSAIIVVASWLIAVIASAAPFLLTGNYTFTQAMFESTSGWSTTGLSIVDVSVAPHIFLLHRSLMLFFGGVGLVLIMLSVLSDAHGMRLYSAEGHPDMLLPNLIKSSRLILTIYSGYILGGAILYTIFGMNWFDSINHSIAALATGGFSTKVESIGYYHSLPIEIISMVLMLLGTISFMAHLFLLTGKWKKFISYCEIKFTVFICALFTPLIAFFLFHQMAYNMNDSIRISVFHTVSALSTTGFQTVLSFSDWPASALTMLTILMLIGGQAGSTSGGIKQYRVYIMLKSIYWTFRDSFSNDRVIHANYIQRPGTEELITIKHRSETGMFIFVYILVFLLGSMCLTAFGYSLEDSMFEFSSAMGGVGLSCGITAPNANPIILWLLNIGMFVGRLEIYVVLIAIMKIYHNIKKLVI